jgi:hypothetical protein
MAANKRGKGWKGHTKSVQHLKPFSKELWATPEHRERMKVRDANHKQLYKDDPWRMKSWGIPCNKKGQKTKEEARAAKAKAHEQWRAAHKLADKYLDYMKKTDQAPSSMDVKVVDENGIMPHTEMVVPETEEEMAIVALREAFLLCVGPTALPSKLQAINTVLAYTKTKPEAVSRLKVEKAEDFLDLIAEVRSPDDDA